MSEGHPVKTIDASIRNRSTIELGLVATLIGALALLAFESGVQYDHIARLQTQADQSTADIRGMKDKRTGDTARWARIETILESVQSNQEEIRKQLTQRAQR